MPWKSAAKIELSDKEEKILREYAAGTHVPLHLKTRSQIIVLASMGLSNNAIEREMGIKGDTVTLWRNRYSEQYEELRVTERESPHKMRQKIEEILTDERRSGAPCKFTDAEVATIIALACEDPMKIGLPFSHWSPSLLKEEVEKRGIVESISARQIGRFLKR